MALFKNKLCRVLRGEIWRVALIVAVDEDDDAGADAWSYKVSVVEPTPEDIDDDLPLQWWVRGNELKPYVQDTPPPEEPVEAGGDTLKELGFATQLRTILGNDLASVQQGKQHARARGHREHELCAGGEVKALRRALKALDLVEAAAPSVEEALANDGEAYLQRDRCDQLLEAIERTTRKLDAMLAREDPDDYAPIYLSEPQKAKLGTAAGMHVFDEEGKCACGHTTRDDPKSCPDVHCYHCGVHIKMPMTAKPKVPVMCNACCVSIGAAMASDVDLERYHRALVDKQRSTGNDIEPPLDDEDQCDKHPLGGDGGSSSCLDCPDVDRFPWDTPRGLYSDCGPAEQVSFTHQGHNFIVTPTGQRGVDSGRMRYRVWCATCGVEVHPGTPAPASACSRHVDEKDEEPSRGGFIYGAPFPEDD